MVMGARHAVAVNLVSRETRVILKITDHIYGCFFPTEAQ